MDNRLKIAESFHMVRGDDTALGNDGVQSGFVIVRVPFGNRVWYAEFSSKKSDEALHRNSADANLQNMRRI